MRGVSWLRCVWLCASLLASWGWVQAEAPVVRLGEATLQANTFPAAMDVAVGLDAALTVQQVAALPREIFAPFAPRTTQPIAIDKPLWLRMQLDMGEAKRSHWLLEMPTVIVDRYEVYQRDANGAWQMAVAGDQVAHTQWPTNALRPRFPLFTPGTGVHDVYIRVVHQLPATIQPLIVNAAASAERDVWQMLWVGMLTGLMTALLLICLQMTITYRDWTYLWYAAYLLATMMSAITYSGVGQQFLWPFATKFASNAVVYFVLAAFAFNLLFVSAMFGKWMNQYYRWMGMLLIASCLAFMVQTFLTVQYASTIQFFMAITVAVCAFILFTAVQAWRKGVPYSGYWLLVYIPYLLSIALVLAENAGQITLPWLPVNTPLLAAMVEAMAMLLCLNAFSRESHAQAVREQTTAQRDPLTGFLAEAPFLELANSTWRRASRSGHDVTLVYALVETKNKNLSTVEAEAMMLRSVRMVRIAGRAGDNVGRIGQNMLGIAMPGAYFGEDLNARLSRLVALGLMVDDDNNRDKAIKFTLAAGAWRETPEDFSAVDKKLRSLLHEDMGTRPRAIRFLRSIGKGQ